MELALTQLPSLEALTTGLTTVFGSNGRPDSRATVLDRIPNIFSSTFPSEIVTCRIQGGSTLRLLCKYSAGQTHDDYDHRGGVAYEAEVYRTVLQQSAGTVPRFYGAYVDPTTGWTWLVLAYLNNAVRVSKMPTTRGMIQAAHWIGTFHAANETCLSDPSRAFLNTYDAEYYRRWAQRTLQFANPLQEQFPWLATLCERFDEFAVALLAPPPTVVHGEFYTSNILAHEGEIYPVDWESAALATGEKDLATLTEGWSASVVEACELEYQRTRWPEGPPADFAWTLAAARMYWHLRWLGGYRKYATRKGSRWRLAEMQSIYEKWRLR